MFSSLCNPYLINWFTRGEGGVKIGQNLVHVVCERPLKCYAYKLDTSTLYILTVYTNTYFVWK